MEMENLQGKKVDNRNENNSNMADVINMDEVDMNGDIINNNNIVLNGKHPVLQVNGETITDPDGAIPEEIDSLMQNENAKNDKQLNQKSKTRKKARIYKNIWVMNIAFFCTFTSFIGLSIIQSSLVGSIGTIGLGLNFACSILGCLFLAPVFVRVLGCKRCIQVSLIIIVFSIFIS